jgi:hypothetical protein
VAGAADVQVTRSQHRGRAVVTNPQLVPMASFGRPGRWDGLLSPAAHSDL